jgi:RNA polymerase sigma factor (sigma-70 family)
MNAQTATEGKSTPLSDSPSSETFRFRFFRKPVAGSRAAGIVTRWELGEISGHLANSLLMEEFTSTGDMETYSILYQLNVRSFTNIIRKRLAGFLHLLSPADVLQEVFLSIYRYPSHFRNENERSFCNWSYSIINNTIRRKLKKTRVKTVDIDAVANILEDETRPAPLNKVIITEEIMRLRRLYSISLVLYINAFKSRLNGRERKALHMVEVLHVSYREAAEELSIRYDNFKMMICRARRKILGEVEKLVESASELSFRDAAAG